MKCQSFPKYRFCSDRRLQRISRARPSFSVGEKRRCRHSTKRYCFRADLFERALSVCMSLIVCLRLTESLMSSD